MTTLQIQARPLIGRSCLSSLVGWGLLLAGLGLAACNAIFDYPGDCDAWIRLVYDRNMKYADAAPREVSSALVYVFDADGLLYKSYTASREELQAQGWRMPLRDLPRGDYQCVVWCGLEDEPGSYSLPRMNNGRSRIEELSCRLQRSRSTGQAAEVGEIQPLFHGSFHLEGQRHFEGSDTAVVHLTKDRNSLRVILQENSPLGADTQLLTASIADCNGLLDYDNRPLDDETLLYRPCYTDYAASDPSVGSAPGANVALMEFTLSRLWIDPERENRLTVYHRQSGDTVLSIPLNRYLCLAREHYMSELSDQEYLDRQDNYSLTFFLQQGRWVGSQVVINSWKMVVSDESFD
ncbi:MAG: FimB/Mfa2 family fimbrial subunit [Bacteroidales bacterium]|nr:FimB/Mfa2 family fimbrial subunit [Bacteroidales bacterium]